MYILFNMFKFNLNITNLFFKDYNFKEIYSISTNITTNKVFLFEIEYNNRHWLDITVDTSFYGYDNAGPMINLALFGFCVRAQVYDERWWDYAKFQWAEKPLNTETEE